MTDRPLLLNDAMVRTYLAGVKTQTRRPIVPQPGDLNDLYTRGVRCHSLENYETGAPAGFGIESEEDQWKCPFGGPGDKLWVREAWQYTSDVPSWVLYRADGAMRGPNGEHDAYLQCGKWRSPMHMPREVSRFTLPVTRVWVERVRDVSAEDIVAEGAWTPSHSVDEDCSQVHEAWTDLWDSIHAKPKPVSPRSPHARTLMGESLSVVTDKVACYVSYPWDGGTTVREYQGRLWYVFGNPWIWGAEFEPFKARSET